MHIETAFGRKRVIRRFGYCAEYAETIATGAAPNGEYWLLNEQHGWVPVASNGRALQAALADSRDPDERLNRDQENSSARLDGEQSAPLMWGDE
jgi:hypothetical protein